MVTSVTLPNNDVLFLSELTVSSYKEILKSIYEDDGDVSDVKGFLNNLSYILSKHTSKPPNYFLQDISILDLFYLVIESRIQSLGNEVSLSVTKLSTNKRSTLSFNLDRTKLEIKSFNKKFLDTNIEGSGFNLSFGIPNAEKLLEHTDNEYLYFLKKFSIIKNNKNSISNVFDIKSAELILNKISVKKTNEFITKFEEFVEENQKIDFLKNYKVNETLRLVLSSEYLLWFTKLIFNEPLDVFYNNLFYLSKSANMSPSYIEQCSPGEYIYFVKKLQSIIEQESPSQENTNLDVISNNAVYDF